MRKLLLRLRDLVRSISSLPTLVFSLFVVLAFIQLGTTDSNVRLPAWLERYNLNDLDTIRTLLAAVITGVFTLTVFAYTMVMNVIDRSISSYSPRLLPLIVAERYHQLILGFSAGTIVHSTILLLGVAEPPESANPPLLAAASSGMFALVSLVLFIYFIHRVSRAIHVNVLLCKSFEQTTRRIAELTGNEEAVVAWVETEEEFVPLASADRCGYLNEIDFKGLVRLSSRTGSSLKMVCRPGSFVYTGDPILLGREGNRVDTDHLSEHWNISENEPIDMYGTGFKHLVEVAVKAASPAINDPGTAMTAVHYLCQLFIQLLAVKPFNAVRDPQDSGVLHFDDWTVPELLTSCYKELTRYLADDPWGNDVLAASLHRIAAACKTHDLADGENTVRRLLRELPGASA